MRKVSRRKNSFGGDDIFAPEGVFIVTQPRQSSGAEYLLVSVYYDGEEEVYRFPTREAGEEFISSLIS